MKKFFNAGMAVFLLTLFSCSISEESVRGDKGAIVLKATMDDGVVLKTTARSSAVGYFLTITGNGYGYGPEPLGEGTTKIDELDPGTYTITLADSELPVALPAYNRPVYSTTVTEEVVAGEVTRISLTCIQDNVGIKFVFDESATSVYPNLVAKIEDDDSKSLEYGTEHAGKQPNPDVAHFKAPSVLKISLTSDGNPVKIKGEDYVEITTAKKELWTITFKTSKEEPGSIEIEADVDKETDPKDEEWGIGGVKGRGIYLNPYSVPGAINMLPAQGVWVKGIVIGEAESVIPRFRVDNNEYILIGKKSGAVEKDCMIAVVPKGSEILTALTAGNTVLIQGNIKGTGEGFTSNAVAVMDGITAGEVAKSLKGFGFNIGFAVKNGAPLSDAESDYVNILKTNASLLSVENAMKPEVMWKGVRTYDFTEAEKIVNFAKKSGMKMHGHVLVWGTPARLPGWLNTYELQDGETWETILTDYITAVVTKFKGKIDSWDVVNEAFDIKGENKADDSWLKKNDFWREKIGDNYLDIAFRTARAADNNVKLFYNETNLEYGGVTEYTDLTERNAAVYEFLGNLRSSGTPIDGIGLQFHVSMFYSLDNHLEPALTFAKDFGGLVHLSELDVHTDNQGDNDESRAKQATVYKTIFEKYLEIIPAGQQFGITMWGVADEESFQSTKYPLLFNFDNQGNYQPKEAYKGLLELVE